MRTVYVRGRCNARGLALVIAICYARNRKQSCVRRYAARGSVVWAYIGAGDRLSGVPLVSRRHQVKANLLTRPVLLQRLEGAVALATGLAFYHAIDANWLLFAALLLAPDISAIGYV